MGRSPASGLASARVSRGTQPRSLRPRQLGAISRATDPPDARAFRCPVPAERPAERDGWPRASGSELAPRTGMGTREFRPAGSPRAGGLSGRSARRRAPRGGRARAARAGRRRGPVRCYSPLSSFFRGAPGCRLPAAGCLPPCDPHGRANSLLWHVRKGRRNLPNVAVTDGYLDRNVTDCPNQQVLLRPTELPQDGSASSKRRNCGHLLQCRVTLNQGKRHGEM